MTQSAFYVPLAHASIRFIPFCAVAERSRATIPTNAVLHRPRSCHEGSPPVPRFCNEAGLHAQTNTRVHSSLRFAHSKKRCRQLPAEGHRNIRSHQMPFLALGHARMVHNHPTRITAFFTVPISTQKTWLNEMCTSPLTSKVFRSIPLLFNRGKLLSVVLSTPPLWHTSKKAQRKPHTK